MFNVIFSLQRFPLNSFIFIDCKVIEFETANEILLVRTDDGQVFGWFPTDKFLSAAESKANAWNATFQSRWPNQVTRVTGIDSCQGISTDGHQVCISCMIMIGRLINPFLSLFFADNCVALF